MAQSETCSLRAPRGPSTLNRAYFAPETSSESSCQRADTEPNGSVTKKLLNYIFWISWHLKIGQIHLQIQISFFLKEKYLIKLVYLFSPREAC